MNEVQKYCTLDGHLLGLAFLTVSESWYQSLDAETQKKVLIAGEELLSQHAALVVSRIIAINTLSEEGVQVYSPTAEELETFKVSQEPVIEYLKTEIDPEVVDGLLGAVEEEEIKAGLK